jgi:hypothetical protein
VQKQHCVSKNVTGTITVTFPLTHVAFALTVTGNVCASNRTQKITLELIIKIISQIQIVQHNKGIFLLL